MNTLLKICDTQGHGFYAYRFDQHSYFSSQDLTWEWTGGTMHNWNSRRELISELREYGYTLYRTTKQENHEVRPHLLYKMVLLSS